VTLQNEKLLKQLVGHLYEKGENFARGIFFLGANSYFSTTEQTKKTKKNPRREVEKEKNSHPGINR